MNQEKKDFLSLAIPPARLNLTETAWFLGFTEHDISVLTSMGLLKPLGHPPASVWKYLAFAYVRNSRRDIHWLGRVSDATVNYP